MEDEILVVNPKRRKRGRHRRKMTALQRQYFGGGRKHRRGRARRNPPAVLAANPRRRRHRGGYRVVHRVVRRNPGLGGMFGTVKDVAVDGAIGTAGILGVRMASNIIARTMNVTPGVTKEVVKAASAVGLPILLGMLFPAQRRNLALAGSAALAVQMTNLVDANVLSKIPAATRTTFGLDVDPVVAFIGPPTPSGGGPTQGLLPGNPYAQGVGLLPGNAYAELGYMPLGQDNVYDSRGMY